MIMTGENKVKTFKEILMEETGQKEAKAAPKYKVGDRVNYIDRDKTKRTGNIEAIEQTDVYEWNEDKEREYIYTLSSTDFLRTEKDIIGFCKGLRG